MQTKISYEPEIYLSTDEHTKESKQGRVGLTSSVNGNKNEFDFGPKTFFTAIYFLALLYNISTIFINPLTGKLAIETIRDLVAGFNQACHPLIKVI